MGTAASLILVAGGISSVFLAWTFPPAAIYLGFGVTLGVVAATARGGVGVGTYFATAKMANAAQSLNELSEMLDGLSESAGTVLVIVRKLENWWNRTVRLLNVASTAIEHANTDYIDHVLEAMERVKEELIILQKAVSSAGNTLQRLKDDLKSCK
ncbi:uncharacterized protein LOC134195117 [Corticium candelabrum]|uniref:uncharacterized protein LOC134195117 n=1 Tax=Corticium candelabrum TaxID=121492 RepID=UPI002E261D04|nr:uncharacterized protein LOC134195117 [Corticium candelabrum]